LRPSSPGSEKLATLLVAGATLLGCAHRPAAVPTVAILPVDTLGIPAGEGEALREALALEVARVRAARPARPADVGRALAADPATSQPAELVRCRDSNTCLAGLGRRVPSAIVLSLTLAGLGDLRLVRSRLVRSGDGLALQDLQETVAAAGLADHAAALARRLFPDALRRPWYRQWWFYAAVVGVAGATAAITWAAVHTSAREAGVVHVGDL
jgi:hypothetical protein